MMRPAFRATVIVAFLIATSASAAGAKRGWYGLGVFRRHTELGKQYLLVDRLAPGGPADRAGLRPRDLIVALNEKALPFKSERDFESYFEKIKVGQIIKVTVRRGVATKRFTLVAEPVPQNMP